MAIHIPFNLDELFDILRSSGIKTFWLITKKLDKVFYLKKYNSETKSSIWTSNYMECIIFPNEIKATQFCERYFNTRKDIEVKRCEVKL